MPVKYNYYHASILLTLLSRTFLSYLFSLYWRAEEEYSKILQIHMMVSPHSILVAEDKKTEFISNPFL